MEFKRVKSQFEQDATNRISVWTGTTTKGYKGLNPGRRIQLKNEDFNELSRKYDEQIEYKTSIYSIWGGIVNYKNQTGNYRVEGAYPDQQFIENADMISGRYINKSDVDEARKVAIIGNQVKRTFSKNKKL